MNIEDRMIGFFDSGVGGISVLREAIYLLPNEDFIYFGDSKNAPYGVRSINEVIELTKNAIEFLLNKNVKTIVVACNTATSAAVKVMRKKYNEIPIIGIEPAIKPAVLLKRKGKIIIMATPMTLSEGKFIKVLEKYKSRAEIVALPCPGLVELIEQEIIEGKVLNAYLKDKFLDYNEIAAVVLGCTHYPFIKEELSKVISDDVPIIDGSLGTVLQLKRILENGNILSNRREKGKIQIYNSLEKKEIIEFCFKLIETPYN